MSKTQVELMLEEHQKQQIFESLNPGDIVQVFSFNDSRSDLAIVIRKHQELRPCVDLLLDIRTTYHLEHCDQVLKIVPLFFQSLDAIREFKKKVTWAYQYHPRSMDNLDYIQVLQRLNEYESRA